MPVTLTPFPGTKTTAPAAPSSSGVRLSPFPTMPKPQAAPTAAPAAPDMVNGHVNSPVFKDYVPPKPVETISAPPEKAFSVKGINFNAPGTGLPLITVEKPRVEVKQDSYLKPLASLANTVFDAADGLVTSFADAFDVLGDKNLKTGEATHPADRVGAFLNILMNGVNVVSAPVTAPLKALEDLKIPQPQSNAAKILTAPILAPIEGAKTAATGINDAFEFVFGGINKVGETIAAQPWVPEQWKESVILGTNLAGMLAVGKVIHEGTRVPGRVSEFRSTTLNANSVVDSAASILGLKVERNALGQIKPLDPAAVKKAYLDLARTTHPDKGGTAQGFQIVNTAKLVLEDYATMKPAEFAAKYNKALDTAANINKQITEGGDPTAPPPSVAREVVNNTVGNKLAPVEAVRPSQAALDLFYGKEAVDVVTVGDVANIKLIRYDDGKFGYSYEIKTPTNGTMAGFNANPLSETAVEAIARAKQEVVEYAEKQVHLDPNGFSADDFARIANQVRNLVPEKRAMALQPLSETEAARRVETAKTNAPSAPQEATAGVQKAEEPVTLAEVEAAITKRVESFRRDAGLMAEREGAGVRLRNVTDANGNVDFVAKDFSLNRAKASMKRMADAGKKYAHTTLYENDPAYRDLVDRRDALRDAQIDEVKTEPDAVDILFGLDTEIATLKSEIKSYEQGGIERGEVAAVADAAKEAARKDEVVQEDRAVEPVKPAEGEKVQVFSGSKGEIKESTLDLSSKRVLKLEGDQRELMNAKTYPDADRALIEKYDGEYDVIELSHPELKQKATEYFDLAERRWYSPDRSVAELYSMQSRGNKYDAGTAQPYAEGGKASKVGASISAKTLEQGLTETFGETAQYKPTTIKEQAEKAAKLIQNDPARARRIVKGEEPLPDGLLAGTIIKAMEDYAMVTGDAGLAFEIAKSPLTSETSIHAQEMRMLAERNPDSAVVKLQEVQKARDEIAEKRIPKGKTAAQVKKESVNELNKEIEKTKPTKDTWNAFLEEIKCK